MPRRKLMSAAGVLRKSSGKVARCGARERTALQAGYLATVQEALSGNRWGRVLNQARPS